MNTAVSKATGCHWHDDSVENPITQNLAIDNEERPVLVRIRGFAYPIQLKKNKSTICLPFHVWLGSCSKTNLDNLYTGHCLLYYLSLSKEHVPKMGTPTRAQGKIKVKNQKIS